ncbi:MAG: hypothetical protein ABIQ44_05070 [Chloroflexia bacterium]
MFNWYESEARQRQRDMLEEAEQSRLAKTTGVNHQGSSRISGRALIWLGHRLVESGKRLQGEDI